VAIQIAIALIKAAIERAIVLDGENSAGKKLCHFAFPQF